MVGGGCSRRCLLRWVVSVRDVKKRVYAEVRKRGGEGEERRFWKDIPQHMHHQAEEGIVHLLLKSFQRVILFSQFIDF